MSLKPVLLKASVAALAFALIFAGAAAGVIAPRLAQQGWTLLNVLSIFGPEGLAERKASAGAYFLSF